MPKLKPILVFLNGAKIPQLSAQLTYAIILSLVPFFSILFTLVHFFHGFENMFATSIAPIIKKHFGGAIGAQISFYLQTLIKNIQIKELGIVSFTTFFITVVFLMMSLENSFNELLKITNHLKFYTRFLKYLCIILVTPFLFALTALKFNILFVTLQNYIPMFLQHSFIPSLRFILGLLFQSLYFIFIYYVIPSKRLPLKNILIGGFTASLLFESLQYINIFLAKSALHGDPAKIYGKVPLMALLFFTWLRLTMVVTLIGLGVSACCRMHTACHKINPGE